MVEAHGIGGFANYRKLGNQLLGYLFSGTLIISKYLIAVVLPFGIKQHQTIVASNFLGQAHKHITETQNRIDRNTVRTG